jgi:hypothetical protein
VSSLTYVYCLVRSARRPSLRGVPAGMPGGKDVRILEIPQSPASLARDWLVVGTVPESGYAEPAIDQGLQDLEWVAPRAVAHEAVVEHFLPAPAVLPMQLFTIFTNDERAVEHVVRDRRRIAPILKRIDRNVEWGLRLSWSPDAAAAGPRARSQPRSGADYLARKREQRDLAQSRLKQAQTQANKLYKAVSRAATAARRRTATEQATPGSRLLLDAAFLVPAGRAAAFRAAVGRQARTIEGAGVTVSLTGPWPAYNFI